MYTPRSTSRSCIVLLFICIISISEVLAVDFTDSDLKFVNEVQNIFCASKTACTVNEHKVSSKFNYDTLPIRIPNEVDDSCCDVCSCDIDVCQRRGTCCPDILRHLPTVEESMSRIELTCQKTQLRTHEDLPQAAYPVFIRTKCSANFGIDDDIAESEIRDKCENSDSYNDLGVKVPVTDRTTLDIYKNHYCSQCNSISNEYIEFWKANITCEIEKDAEFLSNVMGDDIVLEISKTKTCNIVYKWPDNLNPVEVKCEAGLIKDCNVTGLWKVYDHLIEAACHAYTSMYNFKYNNIFCFMCNENSPIEGQCTRNEPFHVISFSVLLDFKPDVDPPTIQEKTTCSMTQVYDPLEDTCRALSCRFPKRMDMGQCVNFVGSLPEIAYRLYLKVTPTRRLPLSELYETVHLMSPKVYDLLDVWGVLGASYSFKLFYKLGTSSAILHTSTPATTLPSLTAVLPVSTTVSINVEEGSEKSETATSADPEVNRDKVAATTSTNPEVNVATTIPTSAPGAKVSVVKDKVRATTETIEGESNNDIDYFVFRIELYFGNALGTVHNSSLLDKILNDDGMTIYVTNEFTSYSREFSVEIEDLSIGDEFPKGALTDMVDNKTLTNIQPPVVLPHIPKFKQITPITITKTLDCPLLMLTASEFQIDDILYGISIPKLNLTIRRKYYYEHVGIGGQVDYLVCADVYIPAAEKISKGLKRHTTVISRTSSIISTPQQIVSLICTCLSLLCLLVTLVTYILFKELRTQPGINNMALTISLICAQALFQFGSGAADDIFFWSCQVIGVFIHFSWLMVLFWMNVCSFHMFRVFNGFGKLRQSTNALRTTTIYSTYCISASLLFIVINIVIVSVDTNQSEMGYGGALVCYISRREMVGYLFALPVGVIIIANLVLFLVVIIRVSRMPTIETNVKNNRNYFKIYAKLSTLTGITWIFGFLFFFIGQTFLEYVFILFNAGQGVFIFVSYVCNARILKLYREKLLGKETPSTRKLGKTQKTTETSLTDPSDGAATA